MRIRATLSLVSPMRVRHVSRAVDFWALKTAIATATNRSSSAPRTHQLNQLATPPVKGNALDGACPVCPISAFRFVVLELATGWSHFLQRYRGGATATSNAEGCLAKENERPLDHDPCFTRKGFHGISAYHETDGAVTEACCFFDAAFCTGTIVRRSER